ncbi:helix-turn-helix domain-containing protein [Pseudarthrobacter sp. ATCC 49987]|uniref:helix-turn-helix domain-containing protein n=1 Tax=Pseudarthrobacter sp. ATCC 49987 TaxID=2698204 RepID=UPI0013715FD7|nr:helix-turn-helix domain-containing protein [Pseudarthrobacter sp. ATCC 49987]
MNLLEQLTAGVYRAQAEERIAAQRTNAALLALKEVATWAQMEELTGLTRHQLQYRLYKDSFESIKKRLLTDEEKKARKAVREYPLSSDSRPGIGPAEAARRLGVSRTTVYAMLERGEFEPLQDGRGRQRIATDSDGKPLMRDPDANREQPASQ